MAERRLPQRVRHLLVLRVQVGEVAVVGERLFVLLVAEVGVGDRELGADRVLAVGIVVDDRLELRDRLFVVDVGVQAEDRATLQELGALAPQLLGRGDFLEQRLVGLAACDREEREERDGDSDGAHATPGAGDRNLSAPCASVNRAARSPLLDSAPFREGDAS